MAVGVYLLGFIVLPITYIIVVILPKVLKIRATKRALEKLVPGPKGHWLLGNLDKFPGVNEEGLFYHLDNVAKYPRWHLMNAGPLRPSIQVSHPETIKQVTNSYAPKQMGLGGAYQMLYPWIGDGLLLSSGSKWKRNRRLLTPGFHFDVLKPYVKIYNDSAENFINTIQSKTRATKQSVDIFPLVSQCTLDVILRCAFSSTKASVVTDENAAYVQAVVSMGDKIQERIINPLVYLDTVYRFTKAGRQFRKNYELSHEVASEVITQRVKEHHDSVTLETVLAKGRYVDFLDILLLAKDEDGNGLTEQEIRDEVETFMFEGHDTTASGVSWILYNLARHPDIQQAARAEVDELLDGRGSDTLEWSDMQKLPYLTRCVKESLRLHPPVPFTGRQLDTDLTIDDKVIPEGTLIEIAIWNMHRNPVVWKDPSVYDPDRFLPENIKAMDSHAFMPFSAGPRNCIGQNFAMNEMKTTVARIIRTFVLKVDTSKPVRMYPSLVLRAENGIHVFIEKRQ